MSTITDDDRAWLRANTYWTGIYLPVAGIPAYDYAERIAALECSLLTLHLNDEARPDFERAYRLANILQSEAQS